MTLWKSRERGTDGWMRFGNAMETHSIEYVPLIERHGSVSNQGVFWFVGCLQFVTVAVGFIGPSMGLDFLSTAISGSLGILFGTIFMALHATQGPALGLPQMIQARAQFGFKGIIVPLFGSAFTYIGFNVVSIVVVSQGLHNLFGWNTAIISLVVICAGTLVAIWGCDGLLLVFRVVFWISIPVYVTITIAISGHVVPKTLSAHLRFSWVAFAAQFAAGVSYNLTYSPFVSDYTRYLPQETSRSRLICTVYLGASISAIWLIIIGAWLATYFGAQDSLVAVKQVGNMIFPGLGAIMVMIAVCALTATVGTNLYSGMLTVITAADSFFRIKLSRQTRIINIAIVACISLGISLSTSVSASQELYDALAIMLYLLAPWTAVNLTDYFFVRRGRYALSSLQEPDGIYRTWDIRGLAAYVAGFLTSIPFFSLSGIYTGPAVRLLGGVDVSWAPGLVVASLAYYALTRSFDRQREDCAISEQR
jgi:NCS1 family nucleobase:cation symporter-1